MKSFIICFYFFIFLNIRAQTNYKDTLVLFKTLPEFFYTDYNEKNVWTTFYDSSLRNLFSKEFYTRDDLLYLLRNEKEIYNLIINFFSLEDKYIELHPSDKAILYFYIYLPEKYTHSLFDFPADFTSESSYLDVGDKIFTFKKTSFKDSIFNKIKEGKITQRAYIPPFSLNFSKPKNIEDYYTDYYSEDVVPSSGNYYISEDEYKYFKKRYDSFVKFGSGGPNDISRRLGKLSKDSLSILAEKTNEILQTYKYFIKQFLTGTIMLRALPDKLYPNDLTTYYPVEKLPKKIINKAQKYIDFDKECRIYKAILNNRTINRDTTGITRWMRSNAQSYHNKLFKDLNSIKIIYVNNTLLDDNPWSSLSFSAIKPKNQNFKDTIIHDIFYSRNTLLDEINSINYTDPEFKNFQLPILLRQLNEAVVRENSAMLDIKFKSKIQDIKISYDFFNTSKLWVQTDVNNQVIYISPFLIRAAFTTVLEKFDLFKLAYEQNNIKEFFEAKSSYISAKAIDNIYNERVYSDYNQTIKFIVAHEIAHIYLKNIKARDKESLCDCYAVYHLKKENKDLDTGVFETLLVKAVHENALRFLGEGTSGEDIISRQQFIEKYKANDLRMSINTCDSLFK